MLTPERCLPAVIGKSSSHTRSMCSRRFFGWSKIRVKQDLTGVDIANLKMSINSFDEIAVEETVRLREAGVADDVATASAPPKA